MDSIKGTDRARDVKPQQDSKHRRSEEAKTHRGARRRGQMQKQRADGSSKETAAPRLGNVGEKPESWEAKGKRRNIKNTTVKENLYPTQLEK